MNAFVAVFCLAVCSASASWVGHDSLAWNAAAHIPSGSVSVGHDGAVIAGPSGSVHTDNGLSGHGAGARLSGPAGEVGTAGGLARLAGPGLGLHGAVLSHAAPLVHSAPLVAAPIAHSTLVAGPVSHASIVGPSAHATIVGARSHAALVAPAWGHSGVLAAPAWGHSGVLAHGLVGHGLHGW